MGEPRKPSPVPTREHRELAISAVNPAWPLTMAHVEWVNTGKNPANATAERLAEILANLDATHAAALEAAEERGKVAAVEQLAGRSLSKFASDWLCSGLAVEQAAEERGQLAERERIIKYGRNRAEQMRAYETPRHVQLGKTLDAFVNELESGWHEPLDIQPAVEHLTGELPAALSAREQKTAGDK